MIMPRLNNMEGDNDDEKDDYDEVLSREILKISYHNLSNSCFSEEVLRDVIKIYLKLSMCD